MSDTKSDYCHAHGGWGSDKTPCKVCGRLSEPNTLPEIPKNFSFDQAVKFLSDAVTERIHHSISQQPENNTDTMSLESIIETLTLAVEANTKALHAILESGGDTVQEKPAKKETPEREEAPKKVVKIKKPKAEPKKEEEEAPAEEAAESSEAPSLDDIRGAVRSMFGRVEGGGKAEWAKILEDHEVTKISELDEDGRTSVLAAINEL